MITGDPSDNEAPNRHTARGFSLLSGPHTRALYNALQNDRLSAQMGSRLRFLAVEA